MRRKENPFPSDGDASKIPKFTNFLICLREDREDQISSIIIPLLDRANSGEIHGNHDAVIVGEIGRGKTHLLKFLEKKLSAKKVRLVSDKLEIPSYNNILPIYVKFDASMVVAPELFVFFFLNYLFGYGVDNFGLLNSQLLQNFRSELRITIEESYEQRIGQDIKKPTTIAAQHAFNMIYDVCAEALKLTGKSSVLFLFDELEGIILTAEKRAENSLILVMDFLRQFHDSINLEEVSPALLYTFYAMTAPAYDKALQARQESGAWLSRLRSQLIEIPPFSEEELVSLISCALENDTLSNTTPFTRDALTYIYRSVMGMPRYAIEALHNSFNLYLKQDLSEIDLRDVVSSTYWLNPDEVIDKSKIAKLKAELGQRYGYLVQIFSDLIGSSSITLPKLIEMGRRVVHKDITMEQVTADLNNFVELGYVEIFEDGEIIKVSQSFYKRILRELDKEDIVIRKVIEPAKFITGSCDTASLEIRAGKISDQERTRRLDEALERVLKQLFAEEGIKLKTVSGIWRQYETRRSPRGAYIKFLARTIVNSSVNQAEIVDLFEKTRANAVLLLHDFDDMPQEQKVIHRVKNMDLPEPYPWVKDLFNDSFADIPDTWSSKIIIENVSGRIKLSDICYLEPTSLGGKSFSASGRISDRVVIDIRGLWYSITEMGRMLDPEHAQLLESTLKYMIQDFFGSVRNELIKKSSFLTKKIGSLLHFDKKALTFAKALIRDNKCNEAISNQQVILYEDLPPGVSPLNMKTLCKSGLFTEISRESWRANSLNEAQKLNPWIRFIVFSSAKGNLQKQTKESAEKANLGPFKESVLRCLDFYFELLQSLQLIKEDKIVLVDTRAQLLQALQEVQERIQSLSEREFSGADHILASYLDEVKQVEIDSMKVKGLSRTQLEADALYKLNLEKLDTINKRTHSLIDQITSEAKEKEKRMIEMLKQAREQQKKAISIYDSLDFNKVDSPLVKALMKKPEVRRYVLEIELSLSRPQMIDTLIKKSRMLEKEFKDGFLMRFISNFESFESNLNKVINGFREIEDNIQETVGTYLNKIRGGYESLLTISSDFSPRSKKEINDMIVDSFRLLSNRDYVKSLLSAGEARLLIKEYIDDVFEKIHEEVKEIQSNLEINLMRQESYLSNSIALLKKRIKKSKKTIYQQLENKFISIKKQVESFDKIIPYKLNEDTLIESINQLLNLVDRIGNKNKEIEQSLKSLNDDILQINRSVFASSFVKALSFISESGEVNSLNYSEFVKTIGNKGKAEETIIELLELGLVRLNMLVKK